MMSAGISRPHLMAFEGEGSPIVMASTFKEPGASEPKTLSPSSKP